MLKETPDVREIMVLLIHTFCIPHMKHCTRHCAVPKAIDASHSWAGFDERIYYDENIYIYT